MASPSPTAVVQVVVRLRPLSAEEGAQAAGTLQAMPADGAVLATLPSSSPGRRPTTMRFALDGVLPVAATQAAVFGAVVEPLVAAVLRGTPATLLAFGGSGAGKTYTLLGGVAPGVRVAAEAAAAAGAAAAAFEAGAVERSAAALLKAVADEGTGRHVEFSAVGLHLGEPTDLLAGARSGRGGSGRGGGHTARAGGRRGGGGRGGERLGGRLPAGATVPAESAASAGAVACASRVRLQGMRHWRALMSAALARRQTAATLVNRASSRAHLFVTLGVVGRPVSAPKDAPSTTPLLFVDLVGVECVRRSGATGLSAREAGFNNAELLSMTRVLSALRTRGHVPWRATALTRRLEGPLQAGGRVALLACAAAAPTRVTLATLRHGVAARGARAGRVRSSSMAAASSTRLPAKVEAGHATSGVPPPDAVAVADGGGTDEGAPDGKEALALPVERTLPAPFAALAKNNPKVIFNLSESDSRNLNKEVSYCIDTFLDKSVCFKSQDTEGMRCAVEHLERHFAFFRCSIDCWAARAAISRKLKDLRRQ